MTRTPGNDTSLRKKHPFDMLEDIETKEQIVMFLKRSGSPDSEFNSIGALDHPYRL